MAAIDNKNAQTGGYHFYAMLSRMKYINRWGLMRNTRSENIQEHSQQTAVVAHALALIRNKYFNGDVDAERTAVIALFHDSDEIITGDLPTPVKYFNESILSAYREVEETAKNRLLSMLPPELRGDYSDLLFRSGRDDAELWKLVKAADTICAYIKCLEEIAGGNTEFTTAAKAVHEKLIAFEMPEVNKFIDDFMNSFSLSLDEFKI